MKYQLVVQFGEDGIEGFDTLIALDDILIVKLASYKETLVDGHDCGMGEFNIFIHTNEPQLIFEEVAEIIEQAYPSTPFSAGYRSFNAEEYAVLWPSSLEEFRVA